MSGAVQPRRILVVKLRHIGDVLLITPVLQTLHDAYPDAELGVCVNAKTEGVLTTNPLIKRVFTVSPGLAKQLKLIAALRREHFDLVVDLTGSDRSAVLARLTGAAHRWGYHRVKGFWRRNQLFTRTAPRRRDVHVVEQQAAFLADMGIPSRQPRLSYRVREEDRRAIAGFLPAEGRIVHLHPVSRLLVKTWSVAYTAQLIDFLAARGLAPVVTASNDPIEIEWVNRLQALARTPMLNLAGKISLPQLAALSERARLFVGVDSAPLHLAAAVGTPVIGIFGPSSEILWGPWCEKKLVLSREMDCRLPCKLKNTCPHIACLREMTPDMVLPKIDAFLGSLNL